MSRAAALGAAGGDAAALPFAIFREVAAPGNFQRAQGEDRMAHRAVADCLAGDIHLHEVVDPVNVCDKAVAGRQLSAPLRIPDRM